MTERRRQGKETRRQESTRTIALSPGLPVSVSTLVIGYGNDLRGDDAVGQQAATAVAAWDLPGVLALAVHQLLPELAEALAAANLAIFVDACESEDAGEATVSVQPLEPAAADSALGHTGDPRALLALTKALYGYCPAAWLISVPARSFAYGAGLSAMAERGLAAALRHIDELIASSVSAESFHQGKSHA
jgi:hydrogenase maturation protease